MSILFNDLRFKWFDRQLIRSFVSQRNEFFTDCYCNEYLSSFKQFTVIITQLNIVQRKRNSVWLLEY